MKKAFAIVLVALLAMTALMASGASEEAATVSTDGSTSMEKVILSLAEQYMADNPGVNITYNPTGSGTGITAALEGRCDIGLSSRALKDSEKESGLTETVVAYDGIAIIVNADNPVTDLSIEQIAGLFSGAITNWSEVGGADAPVVPVGREAGSGTRSGFEEIVGVVDSCKYSQFKICLLMIPRHKGTFLTMFLICSGARGIILPQGLCPSKICLKIILRI